MAGWAWQRMVIFRRTNATLTRSTASPRREAPTAQSPSSLARCDGKMANCLSTMASWNYIGRLYQPRAEILNGTWKFPEAQPFN